MCQFKTDRSPPKVTKIDILAFANSGLTKAVIHGRIRRASAQLFAGCSDLEYVDLSDSVRSVEFGTFMDCSRLTEINGLHNITKIGSRVFEGCSSLTHFFIPDGVIEISHHAFSCCTSLTNVHIPHSVNRIGHATSNNCHSLDKLEIDEGVTEIDDWAFHDCPNLTEVVLSAGLSKIGDAFIACDNLTDITIPASVMEIGCDAFSLSAGTNKPILHNPSLTIHAPAGSYAESYARNYGYSFQTL